MQLTTILTAPGVHGGSSAIARFVRSSGGHAIAVHLAKVPDVSQLHVLQSALKTAPGVQVKPGSFTPGFKSWHSENNEIFRIVREAVLTGFQQGFLKVFNCYQSSSTRSTEIMQNPDIDVHGRP